MSSTITPSESASAVSSKKTKPGKAERAARRSAVDSAAGAPASSAKAMVFAAGVAAPKPQPGKFPVVFQTGAGEPTRDVTFTPEPTVLASTLSSFLPAFKEHPKFNEFLSYTDYDDDDFNDHLQSAALLRLAQQLVHSHVNMGLPQGDFAPIASTEVRVPASVSAFVSQFGEHSVPALGTRFLLRDYVSTVKSVVWAAKAVFDGVNCVDVLRRSWLPMSKGDGHTRVIIADALNRFLAVHGIQFQSTELEDSVLSGTRLDSWDEVKRLLGGSDDARDRFDFLFRSYPDAPAFVVGFTTAEASTSLQELGLNWSSPSAGHVEWNFNAKESFTELSNSWAQKSAAYAHFFELSSSQSNRTAASGSQSQLGNVSVTDSITVVKSHLALSAPEFSLLACFPCSCVYSGCLTRNVILTTPLSVVQRATEFVQLDWR